MGGSYGWVDPTDVEDQIILEGQGDFTEDTGENSELHGEDQNFTGENFTNMTMESFLPCSDYLMFQEMWLNMTEEDVSSSLRARRTRDVHGGLQTSVMWQDYVDLYQFINLHGLSEKDGDDLLSLLRGFENRHNCSLSLPMVYRTVKRAFKRMSERFQIRHFKLSFPFPFEFFGKSEDHNLQPAAAVVLDVMEMVS